MDSEGSVVRGNNTPSMALRTREDLISPLDERLLIRLALLDPELLHAMMNVAVT